jgi:ethanolamine ammonia-lyase small subunit
MSATRELIARLREQMGESSPQSAPGPALPLTPPPRRVFPTARTRSPIQSQAAAHTTALVGIGHVGMRYATDVVLQFQAELAVAHNAVASLLPEEWIEQNGLMSLQSRVSDHEEFLLRPDLGRRLSDKSRETIQSSAQKSVDIQPILADGLSATACVKSGMNVLQELLRECESHGLSVGTPMCARFGRVWLEDEIGELVGAKVCVIILGERPGLGTGDGLSAYVVHNPAVGKTDSDRNMISNIHARGTSPAEAAKRLAALASAMLDQGTSGVGLDLSQIGAGASDSELRPAQVREPLVEVGR